LTVRAVKGINKQTNSPAKKPARALSTAVPDSRQAPGDFAF